ncbi:hypothetical protein Tco_1547649 [Tanacetum coccineum]
MSDVERVDMGSQAEASSSSKRDMGSYISTMKPSDVKALTRKYKIPRDLHPVAVSSEWTMYRLTNEYIGLYEQYFEFAGLRVPFSTLLLAVIRHFHVHISQLVPLGLTRLTLFELYCRSLNIVPSVTLFRVFYKLSKQGDWFTFEKRAGKDFRGKILNETFSCMKKWKGRFFFIDRRAIPDAMCWRHHDSDISDPAPKDGFDEADVIALTHQSIDIRGILSGLLFSAGFAITWPSFSFWMTIEDSERLDERNVIPQHTTTPLSADEQVPEKTDSQQRVEVLDPKIVATRIRKVKAAAKRKVEKNMESEGAGGSEGSLKRRKPSSGPEGGDKEKSSDHIPYSRRYLLEIPAHDSANTTTRLYEEHHDEHSGVLGNRDGNFDDDVDEEIDLEGPDRHVSETTERVVIETESIPTVATRPDNGKSIAQEETPMLDPPLQGIHQRSRVTTPEECRDLMVNLIPLGVREEMNLLDNNVILDRAWFSLARGAMAQAHAICQFESLYDTFMLARAVSEIREEKTGAIRKLLPTVVERLIRALKTNAKFFVPFNYALQTEWGQGLAEERYVSKTYSYVDRISHLSKKPVQDLLKLHLAPPPRDAPKAGSRGIVFAPKLVKATEVARSKDTTSREFSRLKIRSYLQNRF